MTYHIKCVLTSKINNLTYNTTNIYLIKCFVVFLFSMLHSKTLILTKQTDQHLYPVIKPINKIEKTDYILTNIGYKQCTNIKKLVRTTTNYLFTIGELLCNNETECLTPVGIQQISTAYQIKTLLPEIINNFIFNKELYDLGVSSQYQNNPNIDINSLFFLLFETVDNKLSFLQGYTSNGIILRNNTNIIFQEYNKEKALLIQNLFTSCGIYIGFYKNKNHLCISYQRMLFINSIGVQYKNIVSNKQHHLTGSKALDKVTIIKHKSNLIEEIGITYILEFDIECFFYCNGLMIRSYI